MLKIASVDLSRSNFSIVLFQLNPAVVPWKINVNSTMGSYWTQLKKQNKAQFITVIIIYYYHI
jgi:hypothetical protein